MNTTHIRFPVGLVQVVSLVVMCATVQRVSHSAEPHPYPFPSDVSPPSELHFSQPVDGLSVAFLGPEKTLAQNLRHTPFQVYVLNTSNPVLVFAKDRIHVQLAIYDPNGQLLTNLKHYGVEFKMGRPSIQSVEVLASGQMIRMIVYPITFPQSKVGKGSYGVEAILVSPTDRWWPRDVKALLGSLIWGPARVTSPRHPIELQ